MRKKYFKKKKDLQQKKKGKRERKANENQDCLVKEFGN